MSAFLVRLCHTPAGAGAGWSLKPLGQQYVHGITHIGDLLNEQGTEWDALKLEMMFTPDDVNDIKR